MASKREKAEFLTKGFVLTNDILLQVSSLLLEEFNKGLSKETGDTGCVKMLPTFVRNVPDGSEKGHFIGLDLGGTNFRVLSISLNGKKFDMKYETYEIPQPIMVGTGEQLFNHIADCLIHFLDNNCDKNGPFPLGFTFSFPCIQKGLSSAILVCWTKGFKCSGVEGEDVVQLLKDALKRKGNKAINIIALLNDTTGTLMSCAHKNKNCRVGLIIGTGTNACYMEKLENVEKWTGDTDEPHQIIINTEWGAFGDNKCLEFISTDYDKAIDENSLNKGQQTFEKMISGMYMGEIVRRILLRFIREGLILDGNSSAKLDTPYGFKTKYISQVECDPEAEYAGTQIVYKKLGIYDATDEDCEILKLVCCRVSTRAAHLVSAGVATILNKMERDKTTIGVDGSVYRFHPHFEKLMEGKIKELANPHFKFKMMLSVDGSGRGAAIVASVVAKELQEILETV